MFLLSFDFLRLPQLVLRLVAVGQTTHTGHHAEHVVVHGVDADLSSATVAHSVDGHSQLQGCLVDTREVASTAGLVFLRLEREGVHVDTDSRGTSVVLVRLHAVEVATLALRETVLAVELELGDFHGVLARALDTRLEDDLGQQVVGGCSEDFLALVGARVQPRGTAQRRTEGQTDTGQVRTGRTANCVGHNTATELLGTADSTTGQDVLHDTLSGEVIGVVERLATVDLRDEVLVGGAVHERVALDNPHEFLDGVVEVQLDLVAGRGDALSASELELLNEVLMSLLGKAASLLSVQVDVVNVERGSSQALDGGCRGSTSALLIVAAVDPLLELHVDTHFVVLESDQGDGQTGVAAEPELERDVESLGGGTCTRSARVGQLSTSARGIQGITQTVLHQDEVVGVTDHVVQGLNGTSILGQLGPDLHPVTILTVDTLTTNLELDHLDEAVTDVVQPAEAVQVGRTVDEVHGREHNLHVGAVHQVRITVDDGGDTLVKVGLAVEGNFDGLHGEVSVALVQHLPESDLRVARDIDILSTIAYELK